MPRAATALPVATSQASLLARSTTLRHPGLGISIETPLLIPSFSSKGFGVSRHREEDGTYSERAEVEDILFLASEYLSDSMLVSAYDIYHGFVPAPESAITDITIVDSGGYETSNLQDLSSTFIHEVTRQEWNQERHQEVLNAWPAHIPAIFVSYDPGVFTTGGQTV